MVDLPAAGPKRRYAGLRAATGARSDGMAAVAEALLSSPLAAEEVGCRPAGDGAPTSAQSSQRRGAVCVFVPAGIDPDARRPAAIAAARTLAMPDRPAALFVFERDQADAHVLGEVACGRLGPQNYLGPADLDRTIAHLVDQCDPVGLAVLDRPAAAVRRLGPAARRTVFLAAPDAEAIVETYRELKMCRRYGLPDKASLVLVGDADGAAVGRLCRASHQLLGCDLGVEARLHPSALAPSPDRPEPLRVLSQTPASEVWPRLLAALVGDRNQAAGPRSEGPTQTAAAGRRGEAGVGPAANQAASRKGTVSADPPPAVCPLFSVWHPADAAELAAAIEAQAPALLGSGLRAVFRVEVEEAGAPPLAAVRDDGALVAVILAAAGQAPDTRQAQSWLASHSRLLARAYPSLGISAEASPRAVVLEPLQVPPPTDGIRRFLPVRMGGHRGVVLLV